VKSGFIPLGLAFAIFVELAGAESAGPREFERTHPWGTALELRFQRGDDPAWSAADFDHTAWPRIGRRELPSNEGVYWLRAHVTVPERAPDGSVDAIAIAIVASYELYWDGQLIGRNGTVGTSPLTERPGKLDQIFPLPGALSRPGEHVLAMRISSYHSGFPGDTYGVLLGPTTQREYYTARSRGAAFATVAVGGGFVLGILMLLVGLLVHRRPAPVLLGLVCLAAALVQAIQAWRSLFHYDYPWHFPRLVALIASVGLLGMLLVAFVAVFFRLKRPWLWVALLAATAVPIVVTHFFETNPIIEGLWWSTLVEATALCAWAIWRGERKAGFILAGLIVSGTILASDPVAFREQSFLQGMGAPLLGGIIAMTLQLRADRKAARQAQLTAARLEIELLKKNIQPHFLLNTLTTITEVIEQEPKVAVTLIEALASEFRLMARMSSERLVPMRDELQLCAEHLRVMSLRQDVRYSLRTEGVHDDTRIPPALILTLIENGLTHARRPGHAVEFVLTGQTNGSKERLVFLAPWGREPGPGRSRPDARAETSKGAVAEGTGSRYVKARLEESFPGRWTFESSPVAEGWRTVIEISRPTPGDDAP
jgi:hypothetical protein